LNVFGTTGDAFALADFIFEPITVFLTKTCGTTTTPGCNFAHNNLNFLQEIVHLMLFV